MTDFEVGDRVKFAGGVERSRKSRNSRTVAIFSTSTLPRGQLRELPSGLSHIEKLDLLIDRLAAGQFDSALHYDLRERTSRLDLAYKYDRFLSLTSNRTQIGPTGG